MAVEGLTTIRSSYGPKETISRLEAVIRSRGMTVFARIDHAAGAAAVGLSLRPTDVLLFGNARGGTPLMQSMQTIGIDLPLKMLVWQDAAGDTWLSYNDSCFGNALFKRAAADQDFLDTLEAHLKGSRRMVLFRAWGLIDYGRGLLRVAAISFGLAAIYGVIYRIFPSILDYKDSANSWFTPYYFSIVTYTTLGFGDVRPATLMGEIIVSSEVILGYTTLGLLLSVLAQSIARRS